MKESGTCSKSHTELLLFLPRLTDWLNYLLSCTTAGCSLEDASVSSVYAWTYMQGQSMQRRPEHTLSVAVVAHALRWWDVMQFLFV